FEEGLAAKVQGTIHLDKVTLGEPLDFFLAYSSVAAFGLQGSSAYAYACAFQNAFIRYRNDLQSKGLRKGRSFSLCWGAWDRDGAITPKHLPPRLKQIREKGMDLINAPSGFVMMQNSLRLSSEVVALVAVEDKLTAMKSLGFESLISDSKRIESLLSSFQNGEILKSEFLRLLKTFRLKELDVYTLKRVINSIQRSEKGAKQPGLDNGTMLQNQSTNGTTKSIPLKSRFNKQLVQSTSTDSVTVGNQSHVIENVKILLSKVLKLDYHRLDVRRSFQDYGLDSITAVQFATLLEKALQRSIPPNAFIEYPNIELLTFHLTQEGGKSIEVST
ncbi:MAG: beta-ketoacyl reductase, partial [Bacteroidota bacterium]